jgi:hypothetical protein
VLIRAEEELLVRRSRGYPAHEEAPGSPGATSGLRRRTERKTLLLYGVPPSVVARQVST